MSAHGYFTRFAKYLIAFSVVYMAAMALLYFTGTMGQPLAETFFGTLELQLLGTYKGRLMVGVILLLALFYPRFGHVKRSVEASFERHGLQIENAFRASGFELTERSEGVWRFRAAGFLQRLTMLFEDEITVRATDEGIILEGNRRGVARAHYRLTGYMAHLHNQE